MEPNVKREKDEENDSVAKKFKEEEVEFKEEKVESKNFYDMFFFNEGSDSDAIKDDDGTDQEIQERFLDETSEDENVTRSEDDNFEENIKKESIEDKNLNGNKTIEDSNSISTVDCKFTVNTEESSTGEALENNIPSSSGRLTKKKKLVRIKNPHYTSRKPVRNHKTFFSPMRGLTGEEHAYASHTCLEEPNENSLHQTEISSDPDCPFKEALVSNLSCIKWLQARGLLMKSGKCHVCGRDLEFKIYTSRYVWDCLWRTKQNYHRVSLSYKTGSIFSKSRLSPRQVLIIIYYFSKNRQNTNFLIQETSMEGQKTSPITVRDYQLRLRQLCLMWLLDNCRKDVTMGSAENVVEVVECEVLPDSPTLTLCLVEHKDVTGDFDYIVDTCPERSFEKVVTVVLKYVNDGTTIVSQLLQTLSGNRGPHFKVDRKKGRLISIKMSQKWNLKEPILTTVKKTLPPKGHSLKLLFTYLSDFIYRREVEKMGSDPFCHLLQVIKTYYPVK